jgi:photosystem II stability/assembly factor-like uncharacterized protein
LNFLHTHDTHISTVGHDTVNTNAPVLVQFDGTWHDNTSMLPTGLGMRPLALIRGTAHNDVYAVGDGGAILHYDGVSWELQSPLLLTTNLNAIVGVSRQAIFAVGDAGTVLVHRP